MAFRSGYYRVQNASIITEKKHFPFQQRNQQPRSTRLEKKKKWSYRKTNKYSAQFQEVSRGSNKPLSIEVVGGTFMLTSALVPIYAAGFYTSTSGGHSNFRLLTKYLQKRKPRNPTPSVGEGKHSNLNLLPNHQLCPPGEDISKTGERNSAERGWERFLMVRTCLWGECLFLCVKPGDRVYLWSPREGFHAKGAWLFSAGPWGGGFGTQSSSKPFSRIKEAPRQPFANNILVL